MQVPQVVSADPYDTETPLVCPSCERRTARSRPGGNAYWCSPCQRVFSLQEVVDGAQKRLERKRSSLRAKAD